MSLVGPGPAAQGVLYGATISTTEGVCVGMKVWADPLTLEVPQPHGTGLYHFSLLFGLTEGPFLLVWTAVGRGTEE